LIENWARVAENPVIAVAPSGTVTCVRGGWKPGPQNAPPLITVWAVTITDAVAAS
jgi:hypothetical protein